MSIDSRGRRFVALGDPLQLEPVIDLPEPLLERVAEHFAGSGDFDVRRWSVQDLADRRARVGTEIALAGGARVRLGCPLRVHWRCDQPMVGLAKALAYGEVLVEATPERPPLALPPSAWLDVPRADSESPSHFVAAEVPVLLRLLGACAETDAAAYVITPYRDVAAGLRQALRRTAFAHFLEEERLGTVHTFQGREEDVVAIVLGGTGGTASRRFAYERPNFLNVAVTRARRRVFVIGWHAMWAQLPHFRTVAKVLPRHPADTWPRQRRTDPLGKPST
ncbi:MAG: hypothetical protein EA356_04765 [Geminicoccaceae bacterium]|nr:MAG: hypothetical protein EA356_04765 [Geminicoccaceae bacterium]